MVSIFFTIFAAELPIYTTMILAIAVIISYLLAFGAIGGLIQLIYAYYRYISGKDKDKLGPGSSNPITGIF